MTSRRLAHLGRRGEARMVDVSMKAPTQRVAVAEDLGHYLRPYLGVKE